MEVMEENTKKKKKHGSFWSSRGFQNIVCMISFVVMMSDILGMLLYDEYVNHYSFNTVYDMLAMATGENYEQSELFADAVMYEANGLVAYKNAELFFDTGGTTVNDRAYGDITIDLGYADGLTHAWELTGISYSLQDLLTWDDFELTSMTYEQFSQVWNEKIKDPDTDYSTWTETDSKARKYQILLNEPYLTSDQKSLYEYTSDVCKMEEYSQKLYRTIAYIKDSYVDYRLGEPETNLKIAVLRQGSGFIINDFTDITDAYAYSAEKMCTAIDDYLHSVGNYIIYADGGDDYYLDTNMDIGYYEICDNLAISSQDSLYLFVDTSYPKQDKIWECYGTYCEMADIFRCALLVFAVSFLLFAVSFIRRTMLEGRDGQKERVIRNWKTVFVMAFLAVISLGIVYNTFTLFAWIIDSTYDNGYQYAGGLTRREETGIVCIFVLGAVLAATFIVNVLYFYLELVRRIKEKTLYQKSVLAIGIRAARSICCRMVQIIQKIIFMMNGKVRFVAGYLIFLVVNLVVVACCVGGGIAFGLFLMAVADLIIGGYVLAYFKEQDRMREQMVNIAEGKEREKLNEDQFHLSNKITAKYINEMDQGIRKAVEISLKDERMKTELITNVSHDIKTPLTSIITYVDLLKKEPLETQKAKEYVEILDQKSARLKQLIEDLMEASKINSGNITVTTAKLSVGELIPQITAEYENKLYEKNLTMISLLPEEPLYFLGDSRHTWRVLSNLFGNVCKYAMPGTRVYVEAAMDKIRQTVMISIKNISQESLNISADELTERFVRGDESRNTEGNGLGLSIAKSLMQAMDGDMEIVIDGDLFKVTLCFRA